MLSFYRTDASPDLCNKAYCFSSEGFQRLLWENAGFSAQPGIYLGVLKDFKIPVPGRQEQLNICDKLNGKITYMNLLLQQADQAVRLLKERRAALISAAVTGKIDVRGLAA